MYTQKLKINYVTNNTSQCISFIFFCQTCCSCYENVIKGNFLYSSFTCNENYSHLWTKFMSKNTSIETSLSLFDLCPSVVRYLKQIRSTTTVGHIWALYKSCWKRSCSVDAFRIIWRAMCVASIKAFQQPLRIWDNRSDIR